jgi:hypothetical protein
MIKAYRDSWTLGIHSYLSYLRDRLLLCRELLAESGSILWNAALRAYGHRPWRSDSRPHVRLWDDGVCGGGLGTEMDYL